MGIKQTVAGAIAAADIATTLATGKPQSLPEQAAEVQQQQQAQHVEQASAESNETPTTQEPPKSSSD
jgi:hypothetical protein